MLWLPGDMKANYPVHGIVEGHRSAKCGTANLPYHHVNEETNEETFP